MREGTVPTCRLRRDGYTGLPLYLHGPFDFPTRRVWVSYTEGFGFLHGAKGFATGTVTTNCREFAPLPLDCGVGWKDVRACEDRP